MLFVLRATRFDWIIGTNKCNALSLRPFSQLLRKPISGGGDGVIWISFAEAHDRIDKRPLIVRHKERFWTW